MADGRPWPALDVRSDAVDVTGDIEGHVALAIADHAPLAIQDLNPLPPPPGGLWDPTALPPPDPPPTRLAWRICFKEAVDRDRAAAAVRALPLALDVQPLELPDDDWVARSQRTLHAITAGRFIVAPPWDLPAAVPVGTQVVVIEPSMGFGTGHHATTRLCLRALSGLDVEARTVLDLGTGSGVLALAAAALGAREVTGIDIDGDAIEAARQSAALNPFGAQVQLRVSDVFTEPCAPVDLVLANLTGAMLVRTTTQLARLVAPDGVLVLSGFMLDERNLVEAAFAEAGFSPRERFDEDGWCAGVFRAPGLAPG